MVRDGQKIVNQVQRVTYVVLLISYAENAFGCYQAAESTSGVFLRQKIVNIDQTVRDTGEMSTNQQNTIIRKLIQLSISDVSSSATPPSDENHLQYIFEPIKSSITSE